MKKHLEIKPLEGIGNVRFGMSPNEVISEMPEQQIYEKWMGGNLNDSLMYRGIIFSFDKCDASGPLRNAKLCEIRINNRRDVSIFNKSIDGWTEKEFLDYCDQNEIKKEINEFEDREIANSKIRDIALLDLGIEISFDSQNNSVWIEFGKPKNTKLLFANALNNIFSLFSSRR